MLEHKVLIENVIERINNKFNESFRIEQYNSTRVKLYVGMEFLDSFLIDGVDLFNALGFIEKYLEAKHRHI